MEAISPTVLLIFVMTVADHRPPDYPKYFSVYRTPATCTAAAEKYMALNGKANILIKAKCADARNPNLVPYLRNVQELDAIEGNKGGVVYPRQRKDKETEA